MDDRNFAISFHAVNLLLLLFALQRGSQDILSYTIRRGAIYEGKRMAFWKCEKVEVVAGICYCLECLRVFEEITAPVAAGACTNRIEANSSCHRCNLIS